MIPKIYDRPVLWAAVMGKSREVFDTVTPEMFQDKTYGRLYGYALDLTRAGIPADLEYIRFAINEQTKKNREKFADQLLELLALTENAVIIWEPEILQSFIKLYHLKIVSIMATRCQLVGTEIGIDTITEELGRAYDIIKHGHRPEDSAPITQVIAEALPGMTKGHDLTDRLTLVYPELKQIFGDVLYNRLYVLGGLPSMSKNIVADNLIVHLSQIKAGVYFSYDNSKTETMAGLLTIATKVPFQRIIDNTLTEEQIIKIKKYKFKNEIHIIDRKQTADKMKVAVTKLKKKNPNLGWVVVDYFQNIPIHNNAQAVREFEQAAIILKEICQECGVFVLALSQSNDKEKKHDSYKKDENDSKSHYNTFSLGDLKWCAGLGQEAFWVGGMEGIREDVDRAVNIVKNKRGKLKKVHLITEPSIGGLYLKSERGTYV